jgi:hypothetical protein
MPFGSSDEDEEEVFVKNQDDAKRRLLAQQV